MQIELGRWYSSIPYSDVTICNLNSMSKVKKKDNANDDGDDNVKNNETIQK